MQLETIYETEPNERSGASDGRVECADDEQPPKDKCIILLVLVLIQMQCSCDSSFFYCACIYVLTDGRLYI
jgi:hypothetical protein